MVASDHRLLNRSRRLVVVYGHLGLGLGHMLTVARGSGDVDLRRSGDCCIRPLLPGSQPPVDCPAGFLYQIAEPQSGQLVDCIRHRLNLVSDHHALDLAADHLLFCCLLVGVSGRLF